MKEDAKKYIASKGKLVKDMLLDDNINIFLISGEPGAGKTTLFSYLIRTVGHKNVTVFGFKEPNRGSIHDTTVSLTSADNTLFMMDEHPHINITNLIEELKKMRKHNNKIIMFIHPSSTLIQDLENLSYVHIRLLRDYT
jgi:uridine kinase